jgi:hypothetical protein
VNKILYLSILLALSGCDVGPEGEARKAVAASLTDPSSVQFQNVTSYSENVVCGEFNAKNRMGGYVGFKPFVYHWKGLVSYDLSANQIALCNNRKNKVEVRAIQLTELKLKPESEGDDATVHVTMSIYVPEDKSPMHPETRKLIDAEASETIKTYSTAELLDLSKRIAMEDGLKAKLNHRLWPGKESDGIQYMNIHALKY